MNNGFGGPWTKSKLEMLRQYLDAYTTALKNQRFKLTYVDAFAGDGHWRPGSNYSEDYATEFEGLLKGSPAIALDIQDKPFDQFVFIEKDQERCNSLRELRSQHANRNIKILNNDANEVLPNYCQKMGNRERAVVFLDPYATEVAWSTVKAIANTKKIDCWILFPIRAISGMMPKRKESDSQEQLARVFGGNDWRNLYQSTLFKDVLRRESGNDDIANLYRSLLSEIFEEVVLTRRPLKNSKNSELFDLMFAAGNPHGAKIAVRIAKSIIEKSMENSLF